MQLRKLYNKEKGKRCFILANGPSVNNLDLSKLKDEVVIGMNASTLLEDKHGFFQTYYVVSDLRFFDVEFKKDLATVKLKKDTVKVFRNEIKEIYPKDIENVYYIRPLERDGFSFNLKKGFYYGCTTVMLAIQLAFYLGCDEIYLLGVDLVYKQSEARFYKEDNAQIDDSRASVQILNIVNADTVLRNEFGVKIFNCNPNSLIRNYLEYRDFNDLF